MQRVRLDLLSNVDPRSCRRARRSLSVTEAAVDAYIAEPADRDARAARPARRADQSTRRAEVAAGAQSLERGCAEAARRATSRRTRHLGGARDRARRGHRSYDRSTSRRLPGVRTACRVVGPVKTQCSATTSSRSTRVTPTSVMPAKEHRKLVREHLTTRGAAAGADTFVTTFTATWKARTVCAPAVRLGQRLQQLGRDRRSRRSASSAARARPPAAARRARAGPRRGG